MSYHHVIYQILFNIPFLPEAQRRKAKRQTVKQLIIIINIIILKPSGVKCPRVKNVTLKAPGVVILLGRSRQ